MQFFPSVPGLPMNIIIYVREGMRKFCDGWSLLYDNTTSMVHSNWIAPLATAVARTLVLLILACYFGNFLRSSWQVL